jgi:hypothetical protein
VRKRTLMTTAGEAEGTKLSWSSNETLQSQYERRKPAIALQQLSKFSSAIATTISELSRRSSTHVATTAHRRTRRASGERELAMQATFAGTSLGSVSPVAAQQPR